MLSHLLIYVENNNKKIQKNRINVDKDNQQCMSTT